MSLFTSTTRALFKHTISPSLATRRAATSSTSSNACSSATKPDITFPVRHVKEKTWINRFVTPPKRHITAGEYAFVEGTKRAAIVLGGVTYISGAAYILRNAFLRPVPPRMLELMSQMSEEDAERFWKWEMSERDRFIPYKLY